MSNDDTNPLRRKRSEERRMNLGGINPPEPFGPTESDIGTGALQQTAKTEPSVLLLCGECDVVYSDKDDWNNCPRCGDELREVEKA